jgi:hypothetical protein
MQYMYHHNKSQFEYPLQLHVLYIFTHHNNDITPADTQQSHKTASILTVQNKHILKESQATVTNP